MVNKIILLLLLISVRANVSARTVLEHSTDDVFISAENSSFNVVNPSYQENSRYWIRTELTIKNRQPYLIECLSPHLQDVVVEIWKNNKIVSSNTAGSIYPFNNRLLSHKNFLFPLPSDTGNYSVWIGIKNSREMDHYFKIRSYSIFTEYATSEYFFLGIYYGLLFIVILYNLFLYFKGRLSVHLWYSIYITGCILISLKEDGLAFQFLWSSFPAFNKFFINQLAQPLFLMSFVFYSFDFLKLKNYLPGLKKILVILVLLFIIALTAQEFITPLPSEWLYLAIFIVVYFSSFIVARKGNNYGWYFFTGFSIVVLSVFVHTLRIIDILPSNILTVYSFNFGIFLEVVIFSVALAESIRKTAEERDSHKNELIKQLQLNDTLQKELIAGLEENKQLQNKVNRELESKVAERTKQLEEANEKLREFSARLEKISSELDKDNYNLKKEIVRKNVSRVHEREVPYAEFLKIYPADDDCLKVLINLKWGSGFRCRKCSNTKAVAGNMADKRKCSKCGHIESVTANTLFHHLKFPVNKAFYLVYVTFSNLRYTNEELAEIVDLRKSTVWGFRTKVSERMQQKRNNNVSSWHQILLDDEVAQESEDTMVR